MTTPIVAKVILHFVGLCVFTTQTPEVPAAARSAMSLQPDAARQHIVVILPKVEDHHVHDSRVRRAVWSRDIESHTAIIAFRQKQFRGVTTGWKPEDLGRDNHRADLLPGAQGDTWKYIVLTGEHIRFSGDDENPPLQPLGNTLPHISRELYPAGQYQLREGYRPPLYSAAAGVIDLAGGTLSTCESRVPNVQGRIDTEIERTSRGPLMIFDEMNPKGKSLTLSNEATPGEPIVVIVAVVPLGYARTLSGSSESPHYLAYCAMVESDKVQRCLPPDLNQLPVKQQLLAEKGSSAERYPSTAKPHYCADANLVTLPPAPTGVPTYLMTFECSNSQWP